MLYVSIRCNVWLFSPHTHITKANMFLYVCFYMSFSVGHFKLPDILFRLPVIFIIESLKRKCSFATVLLYKNTARGRQNTSKCDDILHPKTCNFFTFFHCFLEKCIVYKTRHKPSKV